MESRLIDVAHVFFERVPHVVFLPGQRDRIIGKRKEKEEAEEQKRKEREYRDSMPADLWGARHAVFISYLRKGAPVPHEDQLMALAKEMLAEQATGVGRR